MLMVSARGRFRHLAFQGKASIDKEGLEERGMTEHWFGDHRHSQPGLPPGSASPNATPCSPRMWCMPARPSSSSDHSRNQQRLFYHHGVRVTES